MKERALEQLKSNFDQSLDQVLQDFHEQVVEEYKRSNIEKLYFFVKFSLPRELGEWLKRAMNEFYPQITESLFQRIEVEERQQDCYTCDHHQQMTQRIQNRISNPPQVLYPQVGVNNVFHQGFASFGINGSLTYIGLNFLPIESPIFRGFQIFSALAVGTYFGVKTYREYDRKYRERLLEASQNFLVENKQRFQEWFDQLIYFSEEDQQICNH